MLKDFKNFPVSEANTLLELALTEDVGLGDVSALWSIPSTNIDSAYIIAKESGVLCGSPFLALILAKLDPQNQVQFLWKIQEGSSFEKGDILLEMTGPTQILLTAERTLLNFVQQLSGVATITSHYVKECVGQTQILDTRKTIPGWRKLQKYAVAVGGGTNHRMGLYDMVMLKDNHVDASVSLTHAVQKVLAQKSQTTIFDKNIRVEVECGDLAQVQECLNLDIQVIMLDNFSLELTQQAVQIIRASRPDIQIEASGNMTLERIKSVSETGVDFISVGALTHSIQALDLSLKFIKKDTL